MIFSNLSLIPFQIIINPARNMYTYSLIMDFRYAVMSRGSFMTILSCMVIKLLDTQQHRFLCTSLHFFFFDETTVREVFRKITDDIYNSWLACVL
jgi:hypothetical protein